LRRIVHSNLPTARGLDMSDTFDLPRDADGFLDMDAFPDDDLDPSASDELETTLQDAPVPDDLDDHWDTLVDRAVDPAAPAVSDDLVGPADDTDWDDPFADVDDGELANPFADLDDEGDSTTPISTRRPAEATTTRPSSRKN
jgi:hypothetical protein